MTLFDILFDRGNLMLDDEGSDTATIIETSFLFPKAGEQITGSASITEPAASIQGLPKVISVSQSVVGGSAAIRRLRFWDVPQVSGEVKITKKPSGIRGKGRVGDGEDETMLLAGLL